MVQLGLAVFEFHLSLHFTEHVQLVARCSGTEVLVLESHVSDLHLQQVRHLSVLLFSEQLDASSACLSTVRFSVQSGQPLLAVRVAQDPRLRTLGLALRALLSLFLEGKSVYFVYGRQHVDWPDFDSHLIGCFALLYLIVDVVLLHILQLLVNTLLLGYVREHGLLLGRLLALTGLFHLLLQLPTVLGLESLPPFELLLSDVLEVVGRLHVHLLLLAGR